MPEEQPQDVDLLVVGGGKAGKSLAMDRAKAGRLSGIRRLWSWVARSCHAASTRAAPATEIT